MTPPLAAAFIAQRSYFTESSQLASDLKLIERCGRKRKLADLTEEERLERE